jgi:hypothetical protein
VVSLTPYRTAAPAPPNEPYPWPWLEPPVDDAPPLSLGWDDARVRETSSTRNGNALLVGVLGLPALCIAAMILSRPDARAEVEAAPSATDARAEVEAAPSATDAPPLDSVLHADQMNLRTVNR